MSTVITTECINCGACEPECPNAAIYAGGVDFEWQFRRRPALSQDYYYIVPEKCTECVGFHDYEACAAVCPVDCCIPDEKRPEGEDVLFERALALHPDKDFPDPYPSRFRSRSGAAATRVRTDPPAPPEPETIAETPLVLGPLPPRQQPGAAGLSPPIVNVEPSVAAAAEAAPSQAAAEEAAPSQAAPADVATPQAAPANEPREERRQEPEQEPELETKAPAPVAPGVDADFDAMVAAVRQETPGARRSLLARWRRVRPRRTRSGMVPADGFFDPRFESKRERERRYGEVYTIDRYPAGAYVRLELPRRVPDSEAKRRLGIGDSMPDYELAVALDERGIVVRGGVRDATLRALCGISSAFPADFLTAIPVDPAWRLLRHRVRDKTLEIVVAAKDV